MNKIYFPDGVQSFPLDIPRIEADDIDLWKSFYSDNKRAIHKTLDNHNETSGLWIGLDIYHGPKYNPSSNIYTANYVDCQELFPKMFETIFENIPMDINCIRVATSLKPFMPHTDYDFPNISIRTVLYETNDIPTFYYVNSNGTKVYQSLPETTNSWIYNDASMLHGSDKLHAKSKVLFSYYGVPKYDKIKELADKSLSRYSDYVIPIN